MRRVTAIVVVAALFGCIPVQVYQPLTMNAAASPAEYAPYLLQQGTLGGTIAGQAFLKTRGGDVKLGAGNPVTLNPATSYAREWFEKTGSVESRFAEVPPDSLFRKTHRDAVVDAQGKFEFRNLPPGKYLVRSIVSWEVVASAYSTSHQGGVVAAIVDIAPGDTNTVILNSVESPYWGAR